MNHTTSIKCKKLATITIRAPKLPNFPTKLKAIVINISPLGLAVVGLDISSINPLQQQTALAKYNNTDVPATHEHTL